VKTPVVFFRAQSLGSIISLVNTSINLSDFITATWKSLKLLRLKDEDSTEEHKECIEDSYATIDIDILAKVSPYHQAAMSFT
jgi:hypothetical protein